MPTAAWPRRCCNVSKKPSGLGKGLEALIPKSPINSQNKLPVALIQPNPAQPRRNFDQTALQELADSIKEKGLLQPILVRPKGDIYELVAGERRYRAAQLAGLSELPVVIRELSERESLEIALIENLQREDLNPVEEAQGFRRLQEMGMTQEEIAQAVSKARTTVANAMRLLSLPTAALESLQSGEISAGHARAILMLPEEQRLWGLSQILTKNLNVRDAEKLKNVKQFTNVESGHQRKGEAYLEVAQNLSRQLGLRVRFSKERKGRLEISYTSEEQLNELLRKLGYES